MNLRNRTEMSEMKLTEAHGTTSPRQSTRLVEGGGVWGTLEAEHEGCQVIEMTVDGKQL